MKLGCNEISIDDAIKFSDVDKLFIKSRENNLKLSDYQIDVVNRNGINYLNYSNYRLLLFEIEKCLNEYYDEELDAVSNQLSELIYYNYTNK